MKREAYSRARSFSIACLFPSCNNKYPLNKKALQSGLFYFLCEFWYWKGKGKGEYLVKVEKARGGYLRRKRKEFIFMTEELLWSEDWSCSCLFYYSIYSEHVWLDESDFLLDLQQEPRNPVELLVYKDSALARIGNTSKQASGASWVFHWADWAFCWKLNLNALPVF